MIVLGIDTPLLRFHYQGCYSSSTNYHLTLDCDLCANLILLCTNTVPALTKLHPLLLDNLWLLNEAGTILTLGFDGTDLFHCCD